MRQIIYIGILSAGDSSIFYIGSRTDLDLAGSGLPYTMIFKMLSSNPIVLSKGPVYLIIFIS